MSQVPPKFVPATSFTTLAQQPITTAGLPGAAMDAEFVRAGDSINRTIDRLSEIQRDDGKLKGGVVTLPSLAPEVTGVLSALGSNIRGRWTPFASYLKGDVVAVVAPHMVVTGIPGSSWQTSANAGYFRSGENAGFPVFVRDGADPAQNFIKWGHNGGSRWEIWSAGNLVAYSPEYPATPDLCVSWYNYIGQAIPTTDVTAGVNYSIYSNPSFICFENHTASGVFDLDLRHWGLIAAPPVMGNLAVDNFTGSGLTASFTLTRDPFSKTNTQVFLDGVYQRKDSYSVAGSVLTFVTAPAPGVAVEIVTGVTLEGGALEVAEGSLPGSVLSEASVPGLKIVLGSLLAEHFPNGAIPGTKIALMTLSGAHIQNFGITSQQLGPLSVIAGKIGFYAVGPNNIAPSAVTPEKIPNGSIPPVKMIAGPWTLNGEPTEAMHATTKGYVDGVKAEAVAAAQTAVDGVLDGKVSKAGSNMSGPLTMGTAPLEVPSGSAPIFGARAFAKITPYFGGVTTSAYKTGTYARNGAGLLTVTLTAHGLRTGDAIYLDFTSGTGTDGMLIATKLTDNSFTVPQAGAATSGNVTARFFRIQAAKNIASVTTSDGTPDHLVCNFTVPLANADYATFGTHGFVASNAGYVMEDTNAGAQLNTANQGFIFTVGNANPRLVSVAFIG